jgi:AhpD family alkylhydroperoxidase
MKSDSSPRRYTSVASFLRDYAYLLRNVTSIMALLRGRRLEPAFRERLMLAVTEVNRCSWCSWYHAKAALAEEIAMEEVRALLAGRYDLVPDEQLPAVLFAQHWADRCGQPDATAVSAFEAAYPRTVQEAILLTLRFINTMNYTVRSLEAWMNWLCFWRKPPQVKPMA